MIITKKEALGVSRDMFQKWNKLIKTGDAEDVSKIYSKDNMFLPTLSGDFEFGREGDIEYFENFLKKNPEGKIIEDDVRVGEKFIVHAGMYNFELDSENDKGREIVKARFTFIYERNNNGEWNIIHHHSSLKPE